MSFLGTTKTSRVRESLNSLEDCIETDTPEKATTPPLITISSKDTSLIRNNGRLPNVLKPLLICSGDITAILLSYFSGWLIAELIRSLAFETVGLINLLSITNAISISSVIPIVVVVAVCVFQGHYTRRRYFWTEVKHIYIAIGLSVAVVSILLFALRYHFSRTLAFGVLASLVVLIPIFRLITKEILRKLRMWNRPALVIGDGRDAFSAARAVEESDSFALNIVGYIDIASSTQIEKLIGVLKDGIKNTKDNSLPSINGLNELPHIIVSLSDGANFNNWKPIFDRIAASSASVTLIPPIGGLPMHGAEISPFFNQDTIALRLQNKMRNRTSVTVKRGFDILTALTAIILLGPVLAVIACLVRTDGGSPIYYQTRLGRGGKSFKCYKFRSMVVNAEEKLQNILLSSDEAAKSWKEDHKLKDDPRITKTGGFLRKTSLDELPQLWNVLVGEMSIIGPRPIVEAEVIKYGDFFDYYNETRPGITGLWQVSGRNDVSYQERVGLDVWYVRNWSLWLDITIFLRTIPVIFGKTGAY